MRTIAISNGTASSILPKNGAVFVMGCGRQNPGEAGVVRPFLIGF